MKFSRADSASGCEVLPTFRQPTPSPSSGCAGGFIALKLISCFPACRKAFASCRGCLPENISVNTVATKAARLIN